MFYSFKSDIADKASRGNAGSNHEADVLSPQSSPLPSVSLQVLRDILKEVQGNMVPRSMLKEWALHTFPNATDYWTFRKMFTIQLALIGLAEFMLHLNRLNPEMLQIAQVRERWAH